MSKVIKEKLVGEYEIHGNKHIAIAVNVNDPSDFHVFNPDPSINNDAFEYACGWADLPPDMEQQLREYCR